MGRFENGLGILVIDPDDRLRAALSSVIVVGTRFSFLTHGHAPHPNEDLSAHDVVVVGVDRPGGLSLVADICARRDAPPVIALAGAPVENKSIEHILLLAQVRGAASALPKPIETDELVLEVMKIASRTASERVKASGFRDEIDWLAPRPRGSR